MKLSLKQWALIVTPIMLTGMGGGTAFAASANSDLNVTLTIASSATLQLGATALSFLAQDPAIQPQVPAQENPVSVLARIRSKGTPTLTMLASDDLKDGSNVIPASAISWTADGAPYIPGTVSKGVPQPTASLPVGSGSYLSAFRFSLANSTSFVPGTYSTTLTYTLIAP